MGLTSKIQGRLDTYDITMQLLRHEALDIDELQRKLGLLQVGSYLMISFLWVRCVFQERQQKGEALVRDPEHGRF